MERVQTEDKLVAFLYLLARDRVTAGAVESVMEDLEGASGSYTFSNEYLAAYAKDVARRLRRW